MANIHHSFHTELFKKAQALGYGELHFKLDQDTGLFAIIAIHSTTLGPALGGCRWLEYETIDAAIYDVLRLARGMTYKSALAGLNLGGGKSVLLRPKQIHDRKAYFKAFGRFVNDLGGRYITAVDSGTKPEDMDIIASETKYVTSTSVDDGDPSPYTAQGVIQGIQAAVKHHFGRDNLAGLNIAIQGLGNVGNLVASSLHKLGAKLTITDINTYLVHECAHAYDARMVPPEEIYSVDCDIFSPCALGAILNDLTIPQLKAKIVVGSANNQLAEERHGNELLKRGIIYGPDYVVNAGGLIFASAQYYEQPREEVSIQVDKIYDTTLKILQRAEKEHLPTSLIADKIAEERLQMEKQL